MISRILYFFFYFVTCGILEAVSSRSQRRGKHTQREEGDIKLDTISDPEEEQCYGAGCSKPSDGKSKRAIIYDVTMEHNTRGTRCGCWLRRNKVAPLLPTVHADVADLYAVSAGENKKEDESVDDKPDENTNDNITLDFSGTKDDFSARKNSALALQSLATCARLNANFMRKTAWTPSEAEEGNGEGCSSNTQETPPSRPSFSSKISFAWNVLRKRMSAGSAQATGMVPANSQGNPGTSKDKAISLSKPKMTKPKEDPQCSQETSKRKKRSIKKILRAGKSEKTTSNSSNPGAIQLRKRRKNDSTSFDRDLYVNINKLTVCHDSGQSSSLDPFFVPEDVPKLSEVPTAYLTINLGEDSQGGPSETKSRHKNFFSRFKLKRN